jgi:hypothetical protein
VCVCVCARVRVCLCHCVETRSQTRRRAHHPHASVNRPPWTACARTLTPTAACDGSRGMNYASCALGCVRREVREAQRACVGWCGCHDAACRACALFRCPAHPQPYTPFPLSPPCAPHAITASLPPILRALFRPPSMLCGTSFMFQPWIRRQMASDGVLW